MPCLLPCCASMLSISICPSCAIHLLLNFILFLFFYFSSVALYPTTIIILKVHTKSSIAPPLPNFFSQVFFVSFFVCVLPFSSFLSKHYARINYGQSLNTKLCLSFYFFLKQLIRRATFYRTLPQIGDCIYLFFNLNLFFVSFSF